MSGDRSPGRVILVGEEPEAPGPYTPDWAEAGRRDTLAEAARRHLVEAESRDIRPGDILLFRWRETS